MSLSEHPAPEWRHKVFVCYVVVMVLVFLLQVPTTPVAESKHVDKLVHVGVFLGFALLFYIDRRWRVWWTFLISVAFAGEIELVQGLFPTERALVGFRGRHGGGRLGGRSRAHGRPTGA